MRTFLTTLLMLLGMGIAGMLHCAGMCGGLAALATGSRRPGRLLAYLAGKTGLYVFLGAVAGAAGEVLVRAAPFHAGSRFLALVTGFVLFISGLDALGLIRLGQYDLGLSVLARPLTRLAGEGSSGALLIGAANALLPCPMTVAFIALAAASGSPISGAATLLILGVTSAAPLAACGLLGYRLGRWRGFPARSAAGALMLVMAALTLYRGLMFPQMSGHMH